MQFRHPAYLLLLILSLASFNIFGQDAYPRDYFRSPVDFRLLLSGTFGEIRADHLHSGMDIKTQGTTGAKVHAVADGYVSRINVSTYGFGKALYITHPNGYVSVYAHLDYFTGKIHDYIMGEHYKRESFEMTLYPEPGEFPVKKGDVVAYSGNSGSSAGPHLHFEIRDEATQKPINPLLFGYEVKDFYRPRMTRLKIYAVDDNSRVNGSKQDAVYPVEGWGMEHRLETPTAVVVSGNVAFGIQCYDGQNDTHNKNGVYSVKVYFDSRLISETKMETFSFDETRYVNSLIDYRAYMENSVRFQRTEVDPGNRLSVYQEPTGNGVVFVDDDLAHTIRYEVSDAAGNLSKLEFRVQGEKAVKGSSNPSVKEEGAGMFYYDRKNHFEQQDFALDAPVGAFYRNFIFEYNTSPALEGCYGKVHHIHNKYTPIQGRVSIAILPEGLDENLMDKALVARVDEENKELASAGGGREQDGLVHTTIRDFGNYTVTVDTIPPTILPYKPASFKDLSAEKSIRFEIKDELSGLKSYRGTLNGQWILMEYDAKNDLLYYYLDEHMKKGSNDFRLEVVDMKDNMSVFETRMVR